MDGKDARDLLQRAVELRKCADSIRNQADDLANTALKIAVRGKPDGTYALGRNSCHESVIARCVFHLGEDPDLLECIFCKRPDRRAA